MNTGWVWDTTANGTHFMPVGAKTFMGLRACNYANSCLGTGRFLIVPINGHGAGTPICLAHLSMSLGITPPLDLVLKPKSCTLCQDEAIIHQAGSRLCYTHALALSLRIGSVTLRDVGDFLGFYAVVNNANAVPQVQQQPQQQHPLAKQSMPGYAIGPTAVLPPQSQVNQGVVASAPPDFESFARRQWNEVDGMVSRMTELERQMAYWLINTKHGVTMATLQQAIDKRMREWYKEQGGKLK